MKKRKTWLLLAILTTTVSAYLLITGSSILNKLFLESLQLPYGTIITWLGLVGLSLSVYLGIEKLRNPKKWLTKILSIQLRITLILALFWIVISAILAGNLSFSFSQTDSFQGGQLAMKIFWVINYALVIIPILVFVSFHILKSLKIKNK